jgi:alpha-ketoglutarate-dependent taurine dioxygenase
MLESFKALLKLDVPDKSGKTLRTNIEQAIQSLPQKDPKRAELEEELQKGQNIPENLEHVWNWFWSLHYARTHSANGPNPITYSEINSWSKLTNTKVRPTEINILRRLDTTYLEFVAEQQKEDK